MRWGREMDMKGRIVQYKHFGRMVGGREILTKEVEARSDGKEVRVVEICVKCVWW